MKRYFVWKDGKYNGDDTEWEEIERKAFLFLVDSKAAEGRYFAFMPGIDIYDDTIIYETTEAGYKAADSMRGVYKYNKKIEEENPIEIVSLDQEIELPDGETVTMHEIIPDEDAYFEEKLITKLWVRDAVAKLEPWEQQLINWKYPEYGPEKTEKEIATILSVSQQAVSRKLKKIYEKLKKLL